MLATLVIIVNGIMHMQLCECAANQVKRVQLQAPAVQRGLQISDKMTLVFSTHTRTIWSMMLRNVLLQYANQNNALYVLPFKYYISIDSSSSLSFCRAEYCDSQRTNNMPDRQTNTCTHVLLFVLQASLNSQNHGLFSGLSHQVETGIAALRRQEDFTNEHSTTDACSTLPFLLQPSCCWASAFIDSRHHCGRRCRYLPK
mmetsp:Transcript_9393/g.25508  ORF Transcript_9393/g.25508 Transcript_9393/m.25508 type:complete len:200 (-) Transcript_9393:380-979(-)